MIAAETTASIHDVVIYGGTSAAVAAAVQAKRMDQSVIVVSPDKHLGGLTSGGLGWTDTGNKAVIGGIAREFYGRVFDHYQSPQAWQWQQREQYGNRGQGTKAIDGDRRTMWIFEPHVAESVFDAMIRDNEIPVVRDAWLDRQSGVTKEAGRIVSITTEDGRRFPGRCFIDATYEGDLMASAKISYHVGRESSAQYGEKYNGVQTGVLHHKHHFDVLDQRVDPYVVPGDPSSGVIPLVSDQPPGEFGSADHKIQAYCFRMCLSNHDANRIPFPRPEGYDSKQYELMKRVFEAGWTRVFGKFDPIPNHKTDTNNHGPMSTDAIGMNYDYPEASYARRREIIEEHRRYQQGWLYFIANDPSVPKDIQKEMQSWGLAADEFTDNGNWPHQLYIREARRMIGQMVMTENHLLKRVPTEESIGMGSYAMDSHNVQRYVTPEGYVQNEGDIGVSTRGPYKISLGSIRPNQSECENLLVPVCVSSSHIAFGSIRMEPVFMILGQSAATVAALANESSAPVQSVTYAQLRPRLLADGQVLETPPANTIRVRKGTSRYDYELPGVVVDDASAIREGDWQSSVANTPFVGSGYVHDGRQATELATIQYRATLKSNGVYDVRIHYPANRNRSTKTLVIVEHADGQSRQRINQQKRPDVVGDSPGVSVGRYRFTSKQPASVTISNDGSDGYVVADAISFVRMKSRED
ncbi:MAG: FAD-dependent oxidoreductase [Planctomycetota bacterium]